MPLFGLLLLLACAKDSDGTETGEENNNEEEYTGDLPEVFKLFIDEVEVYLDGNFVVIKSNGIPNHPSPYFRTDEEVLLLSHTVTPWIDDVAKLRDYAEDQSIDSHKWHLVTGDRAAICDIARRGYFAELAEGVARDEDDLLHT